MKRLFQADEFQAELSDVTADAPNPIQDMKPQNLYRSVDMLPQNSREADKPTLQKDAKKKKADEDDKVLQGKIQNFLKGLNSVYLSPENRRKILDKLKEIAERTEKEKGISFEEALNRVIKQFMQEYPELIMGVLYKELDKVSK